MCTGDGCTVRPLGEFTPTPGHGVGECQSRCRACHRALHGAGGPARERYPQDLARTWAEENATGMRVCIGSVKMPGCGERLPLTAEFFRPTGTRKDGLVKGKRSGISADFERICRVCRTAFDVGHNRVMHYGAAPGQYAEMVKAQRNRCAICGREPGGVGRGQRSLHLDHDHVTGQIRDLLCDSCNNGLGRFRDDPSILRVAAAYIDRHRQGRMQV